MKKRPQGFSEEFAAFQSSAPITPAAGLGAEIRAKVARDLSPSLALVFSKIFGLHVISAVATLSVCPQFGLKIGEQTMGVMHWFMNLGDWGCRMACGFLFMGLSLALSAFVLRPTEVKRLRRYWWMESLFLILISMGFFIMVAPEEVLALLTLGWAAGAWAGSWIALEAAWRLRLAFSQRHY